MIPIPMNYANVHLLKNNRNFLRAKNYIKTLFLNLPRAASEFIDPEEEIFFEYKLYKTKSVQMFSLYKTFKLYWFILLIF